VGFKARMEVLVGHGWNLRETVDVLEKVGRDYISLIYTDALESSRCQLSKM
jgi:hypothetical protein